MAQEESWDSWTAGTQRESWPAKDAAPAQEQCGDFKRGMCQRGDNCKYQHVGDGQGDQWGAAAGEGDKWGVDKKEDQKGAGAGWDNWRKDDQKDDQQGQDSWKKDDKWGAGAAGDSWKKDGQQDAWGKSGAPTPNGKAFWDAQAWNKEAGKLPRKDDWEEDRDDAALFTERLGSSAGIAFDQYDEVPVDLSGQKSELIPACHTFDELFEKFQDCIPDALVSNVKRCCFTKPTPVQKYAIPAGLCGRDVMCCAQTGSGKTAAFLFPIIGRMMKQHDKPAGSLRAPFEGPCKPDTLILTPTRELCIQTFEEAQKLCHRTPYRVARVYGGEKPSDQMQDIARGADVIVACPGRLQDFIGRGIVEVKAVYILVLDEADRMLDMGFEPQIREICENHGMPSKEERQTMMFSATFPENCQKLAQEYLYNYIWVGVGVVGGAVRTVEQRLEQVQTKEKYAKLFEILDDFFAQRKDDERCLVFTNSKEQLSKEDVDDEDTAKFLDEQLWDKKINTGALHGNLTQQDREANLKKFRNGDIDVMIATDVAARGLDIQKVSHVINYDMPSDIDSYVHRIGRTGRIGNKGVAITFISCDESGNSLEKGDVLKELLRIINEAGGASPSWLEGLIEAGDSRKAAYGDWGGKDMRATWDDWNANKGKEKEAAWKEPVAADRSNGWAPSVAEAAGAPDNADVLDWKSSAAAAAGTSNSVDSTGWAPSVAAAAPTAPWM